MKIMLDVGGRNGESIGEFLRWDFDLIHTFEPMPAQFANIVSEFGSDPRVVAHNFGLSDVTATLPVYGSDHKGEASVFASKVDIDDPGTVTECEFVDVIEVFAGLPADTDLFVKLNCEGSEIAILNRLIDTGDIDRIHSVRVEFDISRCVGHENEADDLLARLDSIGFDRLFVGGHARLTAQGLVDDVPQVGSHHDRLRVWLESE